MENSISPCRSYRIFKALFICSLSNRRIRWNHNWSHCRLHRIQTNFYCPAKAQKEAVIGKSQFCDFALRSFDPGGVCIRYCERAVLLGKTERLAQRNQNWFLQITVSFVSFLNKKVS